MLTLAWLPQDFSICRLENIKTLLPLKGCFFLASTGEEVSLVCETVHAPQAERQEDGWRAFRVAGMLDFGLTGVLAGIADVLAAADVAIFALSTYNTDYLLVRAGEMSKASQALVAKGYTIS